MKPLEALDKINTMFLTYAPRHIREDKELNEDLFECIRSALEENERLKTSYLENLLNEESKRYIYKKLKALEIIKEKRVDVNDFLTFVDLKSYNEWVVACDENKLRVLTQEEYKLLKEIFS